MSDHIELKKAALRVVEIESSEGESISDAWEDFESAANPAAVLALIAEVEGLRAQHGRDSAELRSLCQARDDARKERDQLKEEVERLNEEYDKAWRHNLNDKNTVQVLAAEVEALRKDAERYRWLREKVGVDLIFGDYNPWLLSCNTDMTDLEKKTTDAAIDAAITKGSKP